ncbi:hypothetical protein LOTGIDRAFT_119239, partial [Lottia gigantea]
SGRTLRDTTLQSPPVTSLLSEEFISSWSLVADLKELEKDESEPVYSVIAKELLANYEFPVMMMVIHPNGTILNKVNANAFLDIDVSILEMGFINFDYFYFSFDDPSAVEYVKFLKEGLYKIGRTS